MRRLLADNILVPGPPAPALCSDLSVDGFVIGGHTAENCDWGMT